MKITVIGGGPGGYTAAIRAAQLGAEVTIIEKESMGGTCLNVGCIPTKALLHSADLYNEIKTTAKRNGIIVNDVAVDFTAIQKKKATVVKQLVGGVNGLMDAYGITVIKGTAKLKNPSIVEVSAENGNEITEISSDKIIIASGSVPSVVQIPGHDLEGVVDSSGALSFEEIPKSLCVIGGGVIGIEMAHVYQRLGCKVSIVEMLPDILMNMDTDITEIMKKLLKRSKVDIFTETKVDSIERDGNGLTVKIKDKDENDGEIKAEKVLMCVGRRPATETLCLDKLGIKTEKNKILVDGNFETNIKNIYAIGDCIGGIMLAHVASAEGISAVEKIMGADSHMDLETIPSCIYTYPEMSSVGITEKQAIEKKFDYRVGKFPLTGNGKALILGERNGLVKIIADKTTGKILGMHMCGPSATELIEEGVLAIHKGATVEDLLSTVHAHPSVGESVQEAAHAVFGDALNMPPSKE